MSGVQFTSIGTPGHRPLGDGPRLGRGNQAARRGPNPFQLGRRPGAQHSPGTRQPGFVHATFGEHSASGQTREDVMNTLRALTYADVYAHELAHSMAGGHLTGGIVIDLDNDGMAVSGHVPISFGLNPADLEGSYKDAQTAYASALAPPDPSGADYAVAAKAVSLMTQTSSLMAQRDTHMQKFGQAVPFKPFDIQA